MGFGNSTPQTQSTTTILSPQQQKILDLAMPGITNFAANVPQRYQGNTVAGFTDPQTAGQNTALTQAQGQTGLANNAAGTTNAWLSPDALDVSNRPDVVAQMNANKQNVTDQLLQSTLPAIRGGAEATGNFGSSRRGVAEGLASTGASKALANANASTLTSASQSAIEAQLKALGLAPQTTQNLTTGAVTQSGVGDVQQALQQALLNQGVSNFNYDQYAPFLQSQDLVSLLQGIPGGTTQTTASTPQKNPFTSALGGAAAGASLGSAIMPGIGTGIGGGLGALLSFL